MDAIVVTGLLARVTSVAGEPSPARAIKSMARVGAVGVFVAIVETETTFFHVGTLGI